MANEFLQFCSTDTGTNLTDLADYPADADRISGNKPGIARSALNNRALRQANYITSQLAQLTADKTGADVLDNASTTRLLAQLKCLISPLSPVITTYTSSSGTHNLSYIFFIVSGNATVGATYTNNAVTFTVKATIASGLQLIASGSGAPSVSGTLTKTGGTGDSTLTFYAVRAPLFLNVTLVGGGGGGGSVNADGGNGVDTTFGGSLTGAGGSGGAGAIGPAAGGIATGGDVNIRGGAGSSGTNTTGTGGAGGNGILGGAGEGAPISGGGVGGGGAANTGAGGGGGGGGGSRTGGGAGGGLMKAITSPAATYAYAVGTGGAAGGTSGGNTGGGAGATGVIIVQENYQ